MLLHKHLISSGQVYILCFGNIFEWVQLNVSVDNHHPHNLEIPSSSIQAIVEGHAKGIFEFIENDKEKLKGGNAIQLVAEVDGSIVPIVETVLPKEGKQDKRRCRSLKWKEARLCLLNG